MYLFNVVILLLNYPIQYKSLAGSKTHNILFGTIDNIDDIDYTNYGDDNVSIPSDNDIDIDNSHNSVISVNSFDKKYDKKQNGCDERYDNTIEQFINDKLLLNKIDGFFTNKKLLDRLLKIIKQRNETTLEEASITNPSIYHQYDSDIFEQIRQYNNDNRNKSELTHDIFAGGLLNDW
jgi:hypothetical protein